MKRGEERSGEEWGGERGGGEEETGEGWREEESVLDPPFGLSLGGWNACRIFKTTSC